MPSIRRPIPGAHCPAEYEVVEGWERFFIGCDVAQARDFTSIAFLHARQEPLMTWGRDFRQLLGNVERHIRRIERLRRGLSYVDVARYLADLAQHPKLLGDPVFIVDVSGVGRGLASILGELGVEFVGVTMTGGDGVNKADNGFWNVGKSYLLGTTAAAIETRMLQLTTGMHGEEDLRREVEQFEVSYTPSGQVTMAAKGERHDDTVISVALAYFGSQQEQGLGGPSRIIGWR